MSKNLFLTLIVFACLIADVLTQRFNRQQVQPQYCVTPENYYGTCVALSYCPQVVNVFQTTNRRLAQQYVIALQRSCGTRNINGDPVICCTRPQQLVRTTEAPPNPFFTTQIPTANPSNPFLRPTIPTEQTPSTGTTRPTTITTTTTRRVTTTSRGPVTSTTSRRPLTTSAVEAKGLSCVGPDLKRGSCISLKNCQTLVDELLLKQNDATFAEFLRASNDICNGVEQNVCCPINEANPTTSNPLIRNSDDPPRRLPTVEEGCGYTSSSYKKIVGGEVSKKGAWPWIALIGYDDNFANTPFKCGGTLVTARHVVTAAHCIRRDLSFVRLGEHDLSTDAEARHVDIPVARRESHPQYNKRNGHSDIAILYLAFNVKFSDSIAPICLPYAPEFRQKSYVQHTPFVAGWGKTMEGGQSADVLQELQIPIFDNEVCRVRYEQQKRFFTENQFDEATICAGVLSGGKDTCQGDSGGPLMMPEPYKDSVRYYLIGVVSYGIGCARPEIPGVYSSTQHFMDWIIEKIADTA
uniref:CLIP domain-containing serine protease n=1 Tax=Glossina brevipalpis TaxID=37001 RepID=A0A1A9WLK5_9MUSC